MRRLSTVGVAAVLLAMMPIASATATPPLDVTFDVEFIFEPPAGGFGATGSAVDAGSMCPGGTVEEVAFRQSRNTQNVTTVDRFICDAGEGFGLDDSFIMKAQIHIDWSTFEFWGHWVIMDGTGAFTGIHGTGDVHGGFVFEPFGVAETRAGGMHVD